MTTTTATRPSTSTTTPTTSGSATSTAAAAAMNASGTSTTSPLPTAVDIPARGTEPAATFEAGRSERGSSHRPFNPPPSPVLLDEQKAASPEARQAIREENTARIEAYNRAYGAYLETYAEAVRSAPNLDRVRHLGPPASYAPAERLPMAQRAQYDALHDSALATQLSVRREIGARVEQELGERSPGLYVFAEGTVKAAGNSAEVNVKLTERGAEAEHKLGVGPDAGSVSKLIDDKPAVGLSGTFDPSTGKFEGIGSIHVAGADLELGSDGHHKLAYENDFFGAELEDGKVALEAGPGVKTTAFGADAKLSGRVGSAFDAKSQSTEAYLKGTVELGPAFKLEMSAGVGLQFVSPRSVKRAITGGDFFDVSAHRVGGR